MHLSQVKTFTAEDFNAFFSSFIFPFIAILVFLGLWSVSAQQVQTSLGQLPGPAAVFQQASNLVDEHVAEREKEQRRTDQVKEDILYACPQTDSTACVDHQTV